MPEVFDNGAGDGIRTRDPQLGRLMLYQLSYSRTMAPSTGPSPASPISANLGILAILANLTGGRFWWRGEDSNLRRPKAGRFTVCSV